MNTVGQAGGSGKAYSEDEIGLLMTGSEMRKFSSYRCEFMPRNIAGCSPHITLRAKSLNKLDNGKLCQILGRNRGPCNFQENVNGKHRSGIELHESAVEPGLDEVAAPAPIEKRDGDAATCVHRTLDESR